MTSGKNIMISASARKTEDLASRFVRTLRPGAVVALVGELGSGKTTFVRGMARALAYKGRVKSPTFVLLHEYPTNPVMYHFDFYRMETASELDEIGVSEVFTSGGISVIEWADRFPGCFPPYALWVYFSHEGPTRRGIFFKEAGEPRRRAGSV